MAAHFLGVTSARRAVRPGSLMVGESPRWLFRRGRKDAARAALLRSRTTEEADIELREMEEVAAAKDATTLTGAKVKDSLLRRKYVIPFMLACIILFCNTATGINSIIGYNTDILLQSGLSDLAAHWGYVIFTLLNFLMTHRRGHAGGSRGRKFLSSSAPSALSSRLPASVLSSCERRNCMWTAGMPFNRW